MSAIPGFDRTYRLQALSEESLVAARGFKPEASDAALATLPKSGTTWMQQICHQLRCDGGDEEFTNIMTVVPSLEDRFYWEGGIPKDKTQVAPPRLFKTHFCGKYIPPFQRSILVVRDPADACVSSYHYVRGFLPDGTQFMPLEAFGEKYWLTFCNTPSYGEPELSGPLHHTVRWLDRAKKEGEDQMKLLLLFYEDMKEDIEREVTKVAKFLSTDTLRLDTPERIALAVEKSSFQYMKENEDKFGAKPRPEFIKRAGFIGTDKGSSKVCDGKSKSGKDELSQEFLAKIDQQWNEVMLPATGCATYQEFRQKYRQD